MNNKMKAACMLLLATAIGFSCSKKDEDPEPTPVSKTMTLTIAYNDNGTEIPVEGALVTLSSLNQLRSFNVSTNKLSKTTDKNGKVTFTNSEIASKLFASSSANLYIWVDKPDSYLSNYYFGPESILFDNRSNSTKTVYVNHSMTAALMGPTKWILKRATISSTAGELPSCMLDNYIHFSVNNDFGRLMLHMNDGNTACIPPDLIWQDSTFRTEDGDSYVYVTQNPMAVSGSISSFYVINKTNTTDSIFYNDISVSMFHPDSIYMHSTITDNHSGSSGTYILNYFFYRED